MTTTNIEVRALQNSKLEIRKSADGTRTLEGVAAPFDSLSSDLGNFRERIQRGAFSANLKTNPDVRLVADHDLSVGKILSEDVCRHDAVTRGK